LLSFCLQTPVQLVVKATVSENVIFAKVLALTINPAVAGQGILPVALIARWRLIAHRDVIARW
jgi:hypothetical protein